MKEIKTNNQKIAAAKAGMDVKTARKYLKAGKLPSEIAKPHTWKTRKDEFANHWQAITAKLNISPGLQAKTILKDLILKHPDQYNLNQLRTLQRRIKDWRAEYGNNKTVIFEQVHKPGLQSQSDFTCMNELKITINGKPFNHLLFHYMLVFSRWEYVEICFSESFASLLHGFENAVWNLGGVAYDHRTDNLAAATKRFGSSREFTSRWQKVMDHYQVKPSRNNPGESHENGSIEKSHDLFKKDVKQQLLLRGSRDFADLGEYSKFLKKIENERNQARQEVIAQEMPDLKPLPQDKWYSPKILPVKVKSSSTIKIDKVAYSVPSRLINYELSAHVYPDQIKLFYGHKNLQNMPKLAQGFLINYRHIIDSLIRKPGAFFNYQYQEALYPNLIFRKAYERLCNYSKANGHKLYLKLLQMAKMHGEQQVEAGILLLEEQKKLPLEQELKELLNLPSKTPEVKVDNVDLTIFDGLINLSKKAA